MAVPQRRKTDTSVPVGDVAAKLREHLAAAQEEIQRAGLLIIDLERILNPKGRRKK